MEKKRVLTDIYIRKDLLPDPQDRILTDPFGSYTGITMDPDLWPMQDADDL